MGKILLVDDNSDILMVLRVTFEGAGHEVIATEDPLEVLPLVERQRPDAVVLDVMMPERSGWDVLTCCWSAMWINCPRLGRGMCCGT